MATAGGWRVLDAAETILTAIEGPWNPEGIKRHFRKPGSWGFVIGTMIVTIILCEKPDGDGLGMIRLWTAQACLRFAPPELAPAEGMR